MTMVRTYGTMVVGGVRGIQPMRGPARFGLLASVLVIGCSRSNGSASVADASSVATAPRDAAPEPAPSAVALTFAKRLQAEGKSDEARERFSTLTKSWPGSPEAVEAQKEISRIDAQRLVDLAHDVAELNELKRPQTVSVGDVILTSGGTKVGKKWFFDFSPVGNRNANAEKGNTFVSVDFDAASKSKEPKLPCVVAYFRAPDSNVFEDGTRLSFVFRRWDSYRSQLGLELDTGNSFTHADKVKFSTGEQVDENLVKTNLVYFAVTKTAPVELVDARGHGDYPVQFEGECSFPKRATWGRLKEQMHILEWRARGQ